jgi:hypothetical protein
MSLKQSGIYLMILLGLVGCCVTAPGCIDSVPKHLMETPERNIPDPESGIAAWIFAINDRNYGSVYDLLPQSKRAGISRTQFIRYNQENPSPFIASEPVVTDFFVLNKSADGLNATIIAGLQINRPSSGKNMSSAQETVFFTFEETFEENEWKVWAR